MIQRNTQALLLALSGLSLAQGAQAQSELKLSGLLGSGVLYTRDSGGRSQLQMTSTHAAPFLALTGSESLGGDLRAIFRWSNSVFVDSGTLAPLESYLGLSSGTWGTLTLGAMYDLLADATPFTSERYTSLLATHPGNLDRTVGNALSNLVKYKSPVFGGFQFGAMYGFAEADSTTNVGRAVGAELSYASGPLQALAIWESVKGIPFAPATRLGVPSLYGVDVAKAPGTTLSQTQDTATVGLAYTSDGWRWMGNYSHTRLSAAGLQQTETARTIDVGAYKYLTNQLRIGGGYSLTKLASYRWDQVHGHIDYALSKRTSLYLLGVLQKAGPGQKAVLRSQAVAGGRRQSAFEVGMTHAF
ncbi:porin [Variovorax sp. UC122_21]|uniref:porin n=1 Tax=Variovorax TaxID=34072 RepID=UPI0019316525|nr:porin [Variovorax paradoxus]